MGGNSLMVHGQVCRHSASGIVLEVKLQIESERHNTVWGSLTLDSDSMHIFKTFSTTFPELQRGYLRKHSNPPSCSYTYSNYICLCDL